jgi:hypothetical protein
MTSWRDTALISFGLGGPPLLWAATLQFGQVLPYFDCTRGAHSLAMVTFAALASTILAGIIVWRMVGLEHSRREIPFFAMLAALSSGVFAFALTLQAIATLVLTGCEK